MICLCWSAKGGSGTTVVAASLAMLSANHSPTVLVDLGGDAAAALGVASPSGPGLADWFGSPLADGRGLLRLAVEIVDDLHLIGPGSMSLPGRAEEGAWQRFTDACATWPGRVVVDAGTTPLPSAVHLRADSSIAVARPCYIGMQRASRHHGAATGVVVVSEPGRALTARSVEQMYGAPLLAELPWDPAVARAVDSGLLATRLPMSLSRTLRNVLRTPAESQRSAS